MDELKRCPFCGSTHQRVKPVWKTYWFVACDCCKAGGPVAKTKDDAIGMWNARAPKGSEPAPKCGTCKHYIGGGDWNLCCTRRYDLCYEDTDACGIYERDDRK